jgi:prefoldin beta subunit
MMTDKTQEQKIQEMHFIEQNFQNLLMQKQTFQMELSETQSALKEVEKSGDEVFKIIGQLMVKADKKKVKEELENKDKLLSLRVKTIEKQEASLREQLEKLQEDLRKEDNKKGK